MLENLLVQLEFEGHLHAGFLLLEQFPVDWHPAYLVQLALTE